MILVVLKTSSVGSPLLGFPLHTCLCCRRSLIPPSNKYFYHFHRYTETSRFCIKIFSGRSNMYRDFLAILEAMRCSVAMYFADLFFLTKHKSCLQMLTCCGLLICVIQHFQPNISAFVRFENETIFFSHACYRELRR